MITVNMLLFSSTFLISLPGFQRDAMCQLCEKLHVDTATSVYEDVGDWLFLENVRPVVNGVKNKSNASVAQRTTCIAPTDTHWYRNMSKQVHT